MATNERLLTWKSFDRQRWQFEKWAISEFRRALRTMIRPVTSADSVYSAMQQVDYLDSAPILKAYENVYGRVGSYFAMQTIRSLKSQGAVFERKLNNETVFDQLMRWWIAKEGAERVQGVTETTIRRLKVALQEAFDKGDGIEVVARNIVRNGSGIADLNRARVIARTEIISASNLGSLQGAKDTGIPLKKEWLSTQDNRTRSFEKGDEFDHVVVDGQSVLLDGLFNINGQAMQFPGDFTNGASAGNTINCRCTQVYKPITSVLI